MASRGGGGRNGGGSSLRAWAEANARLLVLSIVGIGAGLLGLVAHRRGPLLGGRGRKRGGGGEALSPEVQQRIIVHMNKDHQAEVVLYARHYAGLKLANAATITALDAGGMHLSVTVQNDSTNPRTAYVPFDRPVASAGDARAALTAMAQVAGNALGVPVKTEEELAVLKLDALTDEKYGLARAEMGAKGSLAGTVKKYDAHLFLVWRSATDWPKNIEDGYGLEAPETLPQAVSKALSAHKKSLPGKVKLNVAEADAAAGDEEGTLLVFPLELCVKGVTTASADAVVQALFNGDAAGAAGRLKKLAGQGVSLGPKLPPAHLFVCSHLKRDKRCGLVGPFLVQRLRAIVAETPALGACPVRACSHVGGHAYAGNVLAFSHRRGADGKPGDLEGHWFGYVSPVVARDIVDRHLLRGELIPGVWRGQMGLSEDEQKNRCENCACEKTEL